MIVTGYNEIQEPRRKNVLINYEKLRELAGAESYDLLKRYHHGWVEKYLGNGNNIRFESPQRLIKQIAWPDPGRTFCGLCSRESVADGC